MTATTVANPLRTTESLMAMVGIALAVAGAAVMGALIATDGDHLSDGNWNFVWLVPLLSLAFLTPALAGAALVPLRSWLGGVLILGNAALLLIGAASASGLGFPLGLVYLPGVVLLWRASSRLLARQGSEEIELGPRPFLVWTAGGLTPLLAFLLLASRWYESCTAFGDGRLVCQRESLGAEAIVFGLVGVAVGLLVLMSLLLANLPSARQGGQRWAALLPLAAAAIGLGGLWSSLPTIAVLALVLVIISFALLFLPTPSREASRA